MSLARVDVVVLPPAPRFGVLVWARVDFLRAYGWVLDWPTEERARALLHTEDLVDTRDPTVPRGACVMMLEPREWARPGVRS